VLTSRLGLIHFGGNERARALATLRAAASQAEPTALFWLGRVLLWSDEIEEAHEVLTRTAVLNSGFGCRAFYHVGRAHDEAGDIERAQEMYVRAVEHTGNPDHPVRALTMMHLGALAKRRRDWPQARRWFQEVLDAGPDQNAMAAAHLGEIAYWLNEHDDAIRNYELTLATGTTNAELVGEAAYRLAELHRAGGDVDAAREFLRQASRSGSSYAAKAADLLVAESGPID
jgi:tetratricopeptide (TPR) repeat protein